MNFNDIGKIVALDGLCIHDRRLMVCNYELSRWKGRGESVMYGRLTLLTNYDLTLPVSIFGWRHVKSLFKGGTEAIVRLEADFGGDLVDSVIGFFQELFCLFETKVQPVLVGTGLE